MENVTFRTKIQILNNYLDKIPEGQLLDEKQQKFVQDTFQKLRYSSNGLSYQDQVAHDILFYRIRTKSKEMSSFNLFLSIFVSSKLTDLSFPFLEKLQTCKEASYLLKPGMRKKDRMACLEAANRWPAEGREQLFKEAQWLIKPDMSTADITTCLEIVSKWPAEGREQFFTEAHWFVAKGMSKKAITLRLKAASEWKEEGREKLFKAARWLVGDPNITEEDVTTCLKATSKWIDKKDEKFFEDVSWLVYPGMSEEDVISLFKACSTWDEKGREKLFKAARYFIKPQMEEKDVAVILNAMHPFVKENPQKQNLLSFIGCIMTDMQREEFLRILSEEGWMEKLWHRWDNDLKKMLPDYINHLMQEEKNMPYLLYMFSMIEQYYGSLDINEEEALMDLVRRCHSILDVGNQNISKNIYAIHKKMLAHKAEAVSPETYRVELKGGERLNIARVIEKSQVKEKKPITFAELPEISPDFFSNQFMELSKKLSEQQKAVIKEEFGKPFEELQIALTHRFLACYKLMHAPRGQPTDPVPFLVQKIYAIAKNLSEQSAELNPDNHSFLTPQQQSILELAASIDIQACEEGQQATIEANDKLLPNEKKNSLLEGKSYVTKEEEVVFKALEDLPHFLEKEVDQITSQISGMTPFMKKVISKDPEKVDPVQQTVYLRNLLQEDLGLEHDVRVDIYGSYIDPKLLKMSKQDVLKTLFKCYAAQRENLVENLAESVWRKFNEKLAFMNDADPNKRKSATELCNAISTLCEQKGIHDISELFDWNEEGRFVQIKNELEQKKILLKALGFLETV